MHCIGQALTSASAYTCLYLVNVLALKHSLKFKIMDLLSFIETKHCHNYVWASNKWWSHNRHKVYENKNNSRPLYSDSKEQHILKLNDGCDASCYRNKENSKTSSVTGLADSENTGKSSESG